MKTEEIIVENTLVAEFMETRSALVPDMFFGYNGCLFSPEHLRYRLEWNWLMPVVEKIESLGFDIKIKGITCSINRLCEDKTIIQFVLGDRTRKIELVWSVVIEFIKWYNEQPK